MIMEIPPLVYAIFLPWLALDGLYALCFTIYEVTNKIKRPYGPFSYIAKNYGVTFDGDNLGSMRVYKKQHSAMNL